MKKLSILSVLMFGFFLFSTSIIAQRTGSQIDKNTRAINAIGVTSINGTTVTPVTMVETLIGTGITVSNITYTGADTASGLFTGGSSVGLGLDKGIILSSGFASNVIGPNVLPDISGELFVPGDADLDLLSGQDTYDASILEFDFVPNDTRLEIRFIFGSDEYNEYVDDVNDVFAFFLDGVNIALVPGTSTPILINTVNNGYADEWVLGTGPCTNCLFYVDNSGPAYNTEMDGFTTVITATATVTKGQTHHIKLAIADATDDVFDSWVLIESNSFTPSHVPVSDWAIYIAIFLIGIAIWFRFKTRIG